MSNDVKRKNNARYRSMKAEEGAPRARQIINYVEAGDVGSDYVVESIGQIKSIQNYDIDSIDRNGDEEYVDYTVYKYATKDADDNPQLTSQDTLKAPPIAPLVFGSAVSYNKRPTWYWDSVGVEYEVSYDNIFFMEVKQNTTYTPFEDLSIGEHTLYVRGKNVGSEYGEVGSFTIDIKEIGEIPLAGAPTVTGILETTNRRPVWEWIPNADEYRVSFDKITWINVDTDISYVPDSDLEFGFSTLYVQSRFTSGEWSTSGSFTTEVITPIPAPPAPVVSGDLITIDTTPTWTWTNTGINYRVRVDSGSWVDVGTDLTYTASTLALGEHLFEVQAESGGDWSASGSFTTNVIDEIVKLIEFDFNSTNESDNLGTGGATYDAINTNVTYDTEKATFNGSDAFLDVPDLTATEIVIEFNINTTQNLADGLIYSNDVLLGSNRASDPDPADMGIGLNFGNKAYFFIQEGTNNYWYVSTLAAVNDGLDHKITCIKDYYKREIRIYLDGVLQSVNSRPSLFEDTELNPFYLGRSGNSNRYYEGDIYDFEMNNAITEDYKTSMKLLFIGSSVARGTGTISENGYTHKLVNELSTTTESVVNRCIGGTNTGEWINTEYPAVLADGIERSNTYIALSLGNEVGFSYINFKTNYPSLIDLIRDGDTNIKVTAASCYARTGSGAQYYIDVKDSVTWLELTSADYILNALGALDDGTGAMISALDYGDGLHPNSLGNNHLRTKDSVYILENINTYDISTIPTIFTNTDNYFYKADASITDPALVATTDNLLHWSTEFEINCTDDTTGVNLWSSNQGGLALRLFVDTDNAVKLTDGTTTILTGLTTTELDSFNKIGISVHGYKDLRLFVNNVFVDAIDYSVANLTLTGILEIVFGGLYGDNSNDAIEVGFRNIALWRSAQHDELMESTNLAKGSQEFYLSCDNIVDTTNKSQTDTSIALNDSNITLQGVGVTNALVDITFNNTNVNTGTGGATYNAILHNTVYDIIEGEVDLNGVDAYIEIPTLALGDTYSIGFDVRVDNNGTDNYLFEKYIDGLDFLSFRQSWGSVYAKFRQGAFNLQPSGTISGFDSGKRHRVLVQINSSTNTVRVYINSDLIFEEVLAGTYDDTTSGSWILGRSINYGSYLSGAISNLKIWDSYIEGQEITDFFYVPPEYLPRVAKIPDINTKPIGTNFGFISGHEYLNIFKNTPSWWLYRTGEFVDRNGYRLTTSNDILGNLQTVDGATLTFNNSTFTTTLEAGNTVRILIPVDSDLIENLYSDRDLLGLNTFVLKTSGGSNYKTSENLTGRYLNVGNDFIRINNWNNDTSTITLERNVVDDITTFDELKINKGYFATVKVQSVTNNNVIVLTDVFDHSWSIGDTITYSTIAGIKDITGTTVTMYRGALLTTEAEAGERITLHNKEYYIDSVTDDTHLELTASFTDSFEDNDYVYVADPWDVDAQGYPNELLTNVLGTGLDQRFVARPFAAFTGNYVLLYDGEGTIGVGGTGVVVTSIIAGRIEFTKDITSSTQFEVTISATTLGDHVKNIRIFEARYETEVETNGDIYYPEWITMISDASVLRFMELNNTNISYLEDWEDRIPLDYYSQNSYAKAKNNNGASGGSYEINIDLCNLVGADYWINIPHRATDDFIEQLAVLVRDRLDSNKKVYLEYSNEPWNNAPGFFQFGYFTKKFEEEIGTLPIGSYLKNMIYYSQQMVRIFNIWTDVFNNVVVGSGTDEDYMKGHERVIRSFGGMAASTQPNKEGITYEKAYKYIDTLAIAPYVEDAYYTNSANKTEILAASTATIAQAIRDQIPNDMTNRININLTMLDDNFPDSDIPIICYEGGQHQANYNDSEIQDKMVEVQSDPLMETVYYEYFNAYKVAGGSRVDKFCHYKLLDRYIWGLYKDILVGTPKLTGLNTFKSENPTKW